MKTFSDFLIQVHACSDARKWNGDKTLSVCWRECRRGDWMLWLAKEANMCDMRTLTAIKADCAELVRHLMKDERSINALDAAHAFARGEITAAELTSAAAAAADAADYAAADAASAAYAAYASADASSYASDAAYYAASAASAAERIKILKQCADICRRHITTPRIEGVID